MPTDNHWIDSVTELDQQADPGVPGEVWGHLRSLLKGSFSERPLPARELEKIAWQLIEAMVPVQSEPAGRK